MAMGERGRTLSRIATEFIVIVAGVLAALAVDQWRQSREDLVLEKDLLRSLAQDVETDSTDYARLPERALGRATSAETLLRNFRPQAPRSANVLVAIDTLGPFPEPVTDAELIGVFAALVRSSDLDVADGAYQEFSEGGGQRLVRNRDLRRMIHEYRYSVASSLKYDPVVLAAIEEVQERAHDLGLSPGDGDADLIRGRLSVEEADPFFAAVRTLQKVSVTQHRNGWLLLREGRALLEALHSELGGTGLATP